ncbi:klaroid protein-like isoform X1 [Danaus plexippus]|uniref:klaroid protein-like isoform X1 n=1 Tax=Danaus plexippus TaxID=13037 RepID=UPI002AB13799|nr:klaroid protein-like isoform X1 [Danaus plexippus]
MENPTISELRSRSRSKTPFLRSSCDRENCTEGEEHSHVSGRKTPIKRSTPIKQIHNVNKIEAVQETIEESPHTYRTRQSTRQMEKLIKTSDYSSEESPDRLKGNRKEIYQNEINSQYERVSTSSQRYATLADVTLSPILTSHNVTQDRSTRYSSPAVSACSTDSSFAEQALADASALLDRDPNSEHLPYKLYKMAGEYWNKYPKTDYTYSPLSRDRVELAPGQVAVPNMSRRSLSQFRIQGPNTVDEPDIPSGWKTSTMARRYTAIDSSDDEGAYMHKPAVDQRWWLTRLVETIITTITTTAATTYRKVVGPSHRYPYTERRPAKAGVVSRLAAAIVAPVYWIFSTIKTIVTTTVTTVTENISPDKRDENKRYSSRYNEINRRRWWPWLALLLLPVMGYGYYNYKDVLMYKENVPVDAYKPPEISQDSNINERVAALESWALKVDNRLNYFDKKISVVDNLEARVEEYSVKHLQRNLIRILSDDVNSDAVAEKLKRHFDRNYVSNEQISLISQEIHERLLNSWQTEMNEDKIRQIVQDYLYDVEKKQMEIIVTKIREYVGEVESRGVMRSSQMDLEEVKNMVMGMLQVYDADRTGKVDYALESAGGQILSTKCTELYQIKTKQYSILGIPVWWVHTSPRHALTPGAMPAECWAFQGFPGYLVIRTYALIEVTGFTLEHMSRLLAVEGKIESAPKNFSVYGLHNEMDAEPHLFGDYMYDANGTSIQHFPVKYPKTTNIGGVQYPVAYDIIELRIESNHGNPTYTCVYRFRVHGNPLTDIRKADNI